MADQIRLNAFVLYGIGHIQHETWTHPPDPLRHQQHD